MTTSASSSSSPSTTSSETRLPVGLLGDARKTALVSGSTADFTASRSTLYCPSLGTETSLPPLTWALKVYIPKVGGQSITPSPASSVALSSRSISSSAPAPTMRWSCETPVYSSSALRERLLPGVRVDVIPLVAAQGLLHPPGRPVGVLVAVELDNPLRRYPGHLRQGLRRVHGLVRLQLPQVTAKERCYVHSLRRFHIRKRPWQAPPRP